MEINHGSVTSYFSTSRDDGFSFQWKIERFSALKSGSLITSPEFYLSKSKKNLHWYLEFKVVDNCDPYSMFGPISYEINLCNKDKVNIGIDYKIALTLNHKVLIRRRFDYIESFSIIKKVNLLLDIVFPLLCKDDFINFTCCIKVKSGPTTDCLPRKPVKSKSTDLPGQSKPSGFQNDQKVTLHEVHNTSVEANGMNKQKNPNLTRRAKKNSVAEVTTCTSKQTQACQTDNITDDSSEFEPLKQLSIDLKRIFVQAKNTDVTIRVEEITINAHKTILCARSPVLCSMFEHSTLEATNNEIEVTDIRAPVMKKLINYLYTGEKSSLLYEEACELYYAADKYEILNLREACMKNLLSLLDVNNACSMLSMANCHSDVAFKDQVMVFISKNFNSIANTEAWIDLTDKDTKLAALLMRYCARAVTK